MTSCPATRHTIQIFYAEKGSVNYGCQHSAEHWVASVPKGKTEADRLAEEHGLRNAGEVLPDSNVFYFKLAKASDRRRKRAAGAADIDVLLRHSDVEFLEKQTERLTRVKRVPIPQEDAGMLIHSRKLAQSLRLFLLGIMSLSRPSAELLVRRT